MRTLSLFVASIAAIAVMAGTAFALPNADAEAAYARGDYETAFKLWLPIAMEGSAQAQLNIGRMYERGEWVAQDKQAAMEWYSRAAEQSARDAEMTSPQLGSAATPDAGTTNAPAGSSADLANAVIVHPTRIATPVQPANYPQPVAYPPAGSPVVVPAARPIYVPIFHHHFHHR